MKVDFAYNECAKDTALKKTPALESDAVGLVMQWKEKLRVAIVISAGADPAWVRESIHLVRAVSGVEIVKIFRVSVDKSVLPYTVAGGGIFGLLEKLDRKAFGGNTRCAFEMDRVAAIDGAEEDTSLVVGEEGIESKSPLCRPDEKQLDFVINYTPYSVGNSIRSIPRYGVLEIRHHEESWPNVDWVSAESLKNRESKIRASLVCLRPDSEIPLVLFESYAAVHGYSLFRTRNPIFWKVAAYPAHALKKTLDFGWDTLLDKSHGPWSGDLQRSFRPGVIKTAGLALRIAWRYASMKAGLAEHPYRWRLLLYDHRADDRPATVIRRPGLTIADPFLFEHQGEIGVFFEEKESGNPNATISYSRLSHDGTLSQPVTVLSRPYHLSYPQVFEWDGEIYMIPETRSNKTIELYRAARYPEDWRLERVLMSNVNAVDSTIFFFEGRVWLFTCMAPIGGSTRDELYIYYADSLESNWASHPLNPVISDVSRARPAGALFESNGRLIRPSQDNSKRYGYGVNLNEIEVLTTSAYRERVLKTLTPEDVGCGLAVHTFNSAGQFSILDIAERAQDEEHERAGKWEYERMPMPTEFFSLDSNPM